MIAVKYLVIRVACAFVIMIDKSVAEGKRHRGEVDPGIEVFENLIKALYLFGVVGKDVIAISLFLIFEQGVA